MTILLPQRLQQQPQSAIPVDPRVDLVWTPSHSNRWSKSANGQLVFGEKGGAWKVASPSGAYLSTASTAKTGAMTLIAVVKFNTLTGTTFNASSINNGAVIYSQRTLDTDNSPTLCVSSSSFTGTTMRVWFGRDTSAVAFGRSNTLVTIQTGVWYSITASCDANGVTGIVVNGLSDATQVSTAGTWSSTWGGTTAYVGTNRQWPTTSNDDADIEVSLLARIPQNLSQNELVSLSNNPWQLFQPQRRTLYYYTPPPAPPAPSVSSAWVRPARTQTQQPQEAVGIDWSNPLSRGLLGAWTPVNPRIAGDTAVVQGSVITINGSTSGMAWRGAYGNSANYVRVPRGQLNYTSQVTFEAIVRVNAFQTTVSPYISGIISQYQQAGVGPVLRLNNNATVGNAGRPVFFIVSSGITEIQATSPQDLELGRVYHLLGSYDGAAVKLYIDGVKVASTSYTGSFVNGSNSFISLMSDYAISNAQNRLLNGDLLLARIYNVGKSDAEAYQLAKNPWQLFQPQRRTLYYYTPPPSPPAPSASSAWVRPSRVQTQQPQGAVGIDWSNPLSRGLVIATTASSSFRDLVSNTPSTITGATYAPTTEGVALQGNTNTFKIQTSVTNGFGQAVTWIVGAKIDSFPAAAARLVDKEQGDLLFVRSTGTIEFQRHNTSLVAVQQIAASLGQTAPAPYSVYAVRVGDFLTNLNAAIFLNGRSLSLSLNQAGTETLQTNQNPFILANRAANDRPLNGRIYFAFRWDRSLSDNEIESVSKNPWQLFQPQRRQLFASFPVETSSKGFFMMF